MLDTAIIMQAAQFSNWLNQGTLVGLRGNASPTRQPTADVFPTADGHIQITALRQPQVEKLFAELNLAAMLEMPEFASPDMRIEHPAAIKTAMSDALSTRTTAEWMRILAAAGVPVAEVRELPEVAEDTELTHRNALKTLPSPLDPDKNITVAQAGYVTSEDGPATRSGPPLLGQHTEEILISIGYTMNEIHALRQAGTI